jgi:hypothetical protein
MNDDFLNGLPPSLLTSEDYNALNTEQQSNFAAKLRHCEEIATKGLDAAKLPGAGLFDAIDDIELDALSIMSAFADAETTVSPYRVHSSWTFECDRQAMAGYVAPDAVTFLVSAPIGIDASHEGARNWLRVWAQVLSSTLSRFSAAASFTEAVTHLVIADALVSSYLVFAATVRLSGSVL